MWIISVGKKVIIGPTKLVPAQKQIQIAFNSSDLNDSFEKFKLAVRTILLATREDTSEQWYLNLDYQILDKTEKSLKKIIFFLIIRHFRFIYLFSIEKQLVSKLVSQREQRKCERLILY